MKCDITEIQKGGSWLYSENLKEWKKKRSRNKRNGNTGRKAQRLSEHYLQMLFLTLHHDYGSCMTRAQVERKRED